MKCTYHRLPNCLSVTSLFPYFLSSFLIPSLATESSLYLLTCLSNFSFYDSPLPGFLHLSFPFSLYSSYLPVVILCQSTCLRVSPQISSHTLLYFLYFTVLVTCACFSLLSTLHFFHFLIKKKPLVRIFPAIYIGIITLHTSIPYFPHYSFLIP